MKSTIPGKKRQKKSFQKGMRLKWCMGLNYEMNNSVFNLTTEDKKEIFYASGHIGVIYDYENQTQKLLQGHSNKITALIYNEEKGILVTADQGESCMMIVWSESKGTPLRTFFGSGDEGVKSIDFSKDGTLILTLSFLFEDKQKIRVWNWEDYEQDNPIVNEVDISVNQLTQFNYIKWNYDDLNEFVTTGKRAIRFWKRENFEWSSYSAFVTRFEERKKEGQK